MSEATNYMIWQTIIWMIPLISGIIYLYCCKWGYFEEEEETDKQGEEGKL